MTTSDTSTPDMAKPQEVLPVDAPRTSGDSTPKSINSATEKDYRGDFKPGARFYVAFASLMLLALMVSLDGTSISVALPIMSQKLKGTAIQAFWTGTSFLLASAVIQPLVASLSHIFGRRPLVFVSMILFLIGAIICSVANDFTVILVGRVIQGIGGGGIMAMLEVLITDLVPLRLRGDYMGLLSVMWSLGSVTGPVIGGAFSEKVSWRWIFYLNFPFVGIGLPLVWFFLKMNFKESALLDKLRRVDWVGIFLFVASSVSFLVPVTWGGVMYDWQSWHTLVPMILGIVGLVAFFIWELKFAREQVIRLSIFSTTTAKIAYVSTTIHGIILWCILYYMPLYYLAIQGYTPIIAGIAIFPGTFTVAPLAGLTGVLITKTGHYRWFIVFGWVVTTLGTGILYLLDVGTSIPSWIFITVVFGVGLGVLFPSLTFAVQAASTETDMAFAVAMFAFFRSLGQGLGVAIGGVVFQNTMYHKLQKYPEFAATAKELAKDATGLVQVIKMMDEGQQKLDLKHAFADSLKMVWILMTVLAGVATIMSWWIKSYDLNRALETEQGFQHKAVQRDSAVAVEEGEKGTVAA